MLLCVIGRHWLTLRDESGRRRIDDAADFVRLETASALRRDIPVVPVLVHGAVMPPAGELPEDLRELAFRNAIQLTHAHWDSDMQVLITALRRQVPSTSPIADAVTSPAVTLWWKRTTTLASAGLFVAILAGVAVWKGAAGGDAETASQIGRKSLAGRWSAAACRGGLVVTWDDGQHLEAVCDTGILHRIAGTYIDAKTIATTVTRYRLGEVCVAGERALDHRRRQRVEYVPRRVERSALPGHKRSSHRGASSSRVTRTPLQPLPAVPHSTIASRLPILRRVRGGL